MGKIIPDFNSKSKIALAKIKAKKALDKDIENCKKEEDPPHKTIKASKHTTAGTSRSRSVS